MIVFDTNAVLRFLLQDNLEMADFVEEKMLQEKFSSPLKSSPRSFMC